jgi:chloramphenicol O-acetyltransferase
MACNAYSWEQFKSLKLSKGKYYLNRNNMEPRLVIGRRRKKNGKKKLPTK